MTEGQTRLGSWNRGGCLSLVRDVLIKNFVCPIALRDMRFPGINHD